MKSRSQKLGYWCLKTTPYLFTLVLMMVSTMPQLLTAQCDALPGTISGVVYEDYNNNGAINVGEHGVQGVLVRIFNASGAVLATTTTNENGLYQFSGLENDQKVRIIFDYDIDYFPSSYGIDNGTVVQFVTVPECNVSLGIRSEDGTCNENVELISTCFVVGYPDDPARAAGPTIISTPYNFHLNSPEIQYASFGESGNVWGLAFKNKTQEIFSTAFIKQYAGLKAGHDAIFTTYIGDGHYTTSLFAKLGNLGQEVGTLAVSDVEDCAYGDQVGREGLGAIVISPDEKYLYVVNIHNNTLVRLETVNPTPETTVAYQIPGEGMYAFGLKYYNGKIYVGNTYPGDKVEVLEFDPSTGSFKDTKVNAPAGRHWDSPIVYRSPAYWLTDIDFTDKGDMLLSLSDRLGHTYCNPINNRLDDQNGDLVIAFKNEGEGWTLEDKSDGKEFFSDDYWVANPNYHTEITTGGIYVMPGSSTVVATVFDPDLNTFSGGLHRYDTNTGKKVAAIELYTREAVVMFGKATGFGDLVPACGLPDIEVGNRVWIDKNKNGTQDADELGVEGFVLNLLDYNCNVIASTTTGEDGSYYFNGENVLGGIDPGAQYFIGISPAFIDENTSLINFNSQYWDFTTFNTGQKGISSEATTTSCENGVIAFKTTGTDHNHDIGLVPSGDCKLKISKKVLNERGVKNTDNVVFEIEVLNNGTQSLTDIVFKDNLPSSYKFSMDGNPGWEANGNTLTGIIPGEILPGEKKSIKLYLSFNSVLNKFPVFTNEVELTKVSDIFGNEIDDISACFEFDSERRSEDTPVICDLALIHKPGKKVINYTDDIVDFTTTVCNQGTIPSSSFTIVNYINPEFEFDESINDGWRVSDDGTLLFYDVNNKLEPGTCKDIRLTLKIKDSKEVERILNYSEIAACNCDGLTEDFDSTPDSDVSNDAGGKIDTYTDDYFAGNGIDDEDDHDVAGIIVNLVNLKITKTSASRKIKSGEENIFNIRVENIGRTNVSSMKLVDNLPEYMKYSGDIWELVDGKPEMFVQFDQPFKPGDIFETEIRVIVSPNIQLPSILVNNVAIKEIYDDSGEDVSNPNFHDLFGSFEESGIIAEYYYPYEDDYDNAIVAILPPPVVNSCYECRPASTPNDGQYVVEIKLISLSGEDWFVESSLDLYDNGSALPPAIPTLLADGESLSETPHSTPGLSEYTLYANRIDGQGFSIRLRNKFGDLEQLVIESGLCEFDKLTLNGPRSLCSGNEADYTVSGVSSGATLYWYIDGLLIQGVSGDNYTIDWSSYSDGRHLVEVFSDAGCSAPASVEVSVGIADLSQIACIGDLNVSVNQDCSFTITPQMLVAGLINSTSPYIVILHDANGNEIPNATLTGEHVGSMVMATLQEGCGGNSCWTNIFVEDKTPPVSICRDIELPCYKLDQYEGPFQKDNCGGPIENVIVNEEYISLDCDPDYVMIIDRTYQATDQYGNKSELCNMQIKLQRPDLDLIEMPADFKVADGEALVCNAYETDENGFPAVSLTGAPTIAGLSLYPECDPLCNLTVWYVDAEYNFCGCTRQIVRTWYFYEAWCSSYNIITKTQVIEITDNVPPSIEPVSDITVSTTSHSDCEAQVALPGFVVTDNCNEINKVNVSYNGHFIDNFTGNAIITLPVGTHEIKYTAYDECDNSDFVTFFITVEDNLAPVAICKGEIIVSLNSQGDAYVRPDHIDDGSYDGCGIDYMEIARMGSYTNIPDHEFSDHVDFDCSDVGEPVIVVLRVWDTSGNSNSCMMTVNVQDKHTPVITCPSDVTIDCADVRTDMDLTIYGDATVFDACGADIYELDADFNLDLCRVGTITRNFEATDGINTATCSQTIYVESFDYFNPITDVIKPLNYSVENHCSTEDLLPDNLPEGYGWPVITQSSCGMAAASYKDQVYEIVQGACFKIVRRWKIIDWCESERLGGDYEPYIFEQDIMITNTIAPEFVGPTPQDTTFFTEKGVCDEGRVTLTFQGEDDCTPDNKLKWRYSIDLYDDGVIDIQNNGIGNIASINADLPAGTHRILWTFEDQCGNLVTKSHLVTVKNNDKPDVVGLDEISVSVIPWDLDGDGEADIEMACIFAWTLDVSSTSACCTEPLVFSFSEDPNDIERCFDCLDVGQPTFVELWAHDCNGNSDYVIVKIDVQDNNDSDVCEKLCEIHPVIAVIEADSEQICEDNSATLTANGGSQYLWSTGEETQSIEVNPTETTTYYVTVTNEYRCEDYAEIIIVVHPTPVPDIFGEDICEGESTQLTATGGLIYLWNTGETNSTITVNPTVNTTYSVTITDAFGCVGSNSYEVNVFPLPIVTIDGNNDICLGSDTELTAQGGNSYIWSTGETTQSIIINPINTTTYSVTVTGEGGCTAEATKTVTVHGQLISAQILGESEICLGEQTNLEAVMSGGIPATYLWDNGEITNTILVSPTNNTTYEVTITDNNGCTISATKLVIVRDLPDASISVDDNGNICVGGSAVLTASGGDIYQWSTGETTPSITVSPSIDTEYTVTVTDIFGCVNSASQIVVVNDIPQASISGNDEICIGSETILTASGGTSYLWNTGATTASITVNPLATTEYSVTVSTALGCADIASVTVTVNGLTISGALIGNNEVCLGEEVVLEAILGGGTPVSYNWNTGDNTNPITVFPDETTTYAVTITDINGCTAAATKQVIVHPLPEVSIDGQDICVGESVVLTASGGTSYVWSNGETSSSITVQPNSDTEYSVTVTDANGCSNTEIKTIHVFELPDVFITGETEVCLGTVGVLTASESESYIWSTDETTQSITIAPEVNTEYSVTVTNSDGCSNSTSVTVVVNGMLSTASIIGNLDLCIGDETVLEAILNEGTPLSYDWSTGGTTSSITVSPDENTIYSITITDINGCISTSSVEVIVHELPNVAIDGHDICFGESVDLIASGGTSYVWSTGEISETITVSPTTATEYSVTATNDEGCSASATIEVNILQTPGVVITGDLEICVDEEATLTASGGDSFLWSTGQTTSQITVHPDETTTYSVTVTSNNGCESVSSVQVVVHGTESSVVFSGDTQICIGESTTLTAGIDGGTADSYLWSTGDHDASIFVAPNITTEYSVTVVSSFGCESIGTVSVVVNPLPIIIVDGDNSVCPSNSTTLTASGGISYLWSTGETSASILVSPLDDTEYIVIGTDEYGCSSEVAITVSVLTPSEINIIGENITCFGASTELTAQGGVSYLWSTGETTPVITVNPEINTEYSVVGTDSNGCTSEASIFIQVHPVFVPEISGDNIICEGEAVQLTATEGTTYNWNTGETTRTITVQPDETTTYSVTVTDDNGCIGEAVFEISVEPAILQCETQDITLYLDETGEAMIYYEDIAVEGINHCIDLDVDITPNFVSCNDAASGISVEVIVVLTNPLTNESLTCSVNVTAVDTISPSIICPANLTINCEDYIPNQSLSVYGSAMASDNCPINLTINETPIFDLNDCNVGQITRTFEASDFSGNSDVCVQVITIENTNPLVGADIQFPSDITLENCGSADPGDAGIVNIDESSFSCGNIEITYTDNIDETLCSGTFQRTWTVTDLCQVVPGTSQGVWTHVQNITLNVAQPIITGPNSYIIFRDTFTCEASLDAILHTSNGCDLEYFVNGIPASDFDLRGNYSDGQHHMILVVKESCSGLSDTLDFNLIVRGVAESIACIKTYPVMTDLLIIEENVYDHVKIIQGCPLNDEIIASYSPTNPYDIIRTYNCDSIAAHHIPGGDYAVTDVVIYFYREGQTTPFNQCIALVGMLDPQNFCDLEGLISGDVSTEDNKPVPGVAVELVGSGMPEEMTTETGEYAFPSMVGGESYDLVPFKNDNPLNGVNTLDLIYMQRHILGQELLNSPYKMIAADVNKDGRISVADIQQTRKVILGIYDNFPDNHSWRLIKGDYEFPDTQNPFDGFIPETYHIDNLSGNMNIDWIGVKIADVDNSYQASGEENTVRTRSVGLTFNVKNQILPKGKAIIPVYAGESKNLAGFQIALPFNGVSDVSVAPGVLSVHADNFVYDGHNLLLSWNTFDGQSIDKGDVLFFIYVDVDNETTVERVVDIWSDSVLSPEYYDSSLIADRLGWRIDRVESGDFEVFGNSPNPWSHETNIEFIIPQNGSVEIRVTDVTGRMVYNKTSYFDAGRNSIKLTNNQLDVAGVLICELKYQHEVKNIKMLNIR